MKKILISFGFLFFIFCQIYGQKKVFSFQEAGALNISVVDLDNKYKSAIHVDPAKAVFKTSKEQTELQNAYRDFLLSLGDFLSKNGFEWEGPTRSFNRIYFNRNGKIDYFIFNFYGNLAKQKENEFKRLVELYIQNYKFPLKAKVNFSQCSPVTYMPKPNKNNKKI
ncbi:MAG: hypothetical protein PHO94_05940 [Petrimonas sp.]|nr:hypothetical protein [Petrimonas sp.]